MALFDSHCHLTYGELADDPHGAWSRALEAGVESALVVAIDAPTAPQVLEFVAGYETLHAAVGIHPNEIASASAADMVEIARLSRDPNVVAIGETGLDSYWDRAPLSLQQEFLERHVELAFETDLPLVLHIRDEYPLAAELLAPHAKAGLRGIIHCFAGAAAEADPFIEWGWPISFSGILTYPKAGNVRAAAERTPLDQCLVETDSPWLTPRGHGKRANEPAFVRSTAATLAEIKGVPIETVEIATTRNAELVFGL